MRPQGYTGNDSVCLDTTWLEAITVINVCLTAGVTADVTVDVRLCHPLSEALSGWCYRAVMAFTGNYR